MKKKKSREIVRGDANGSFLTGRAAVEPIKRTIHRRDGFAAGEPRTGPDLLESISTYGRIET